MGEKAFWKSKTVQGVAVIVVSALLRIAVMRGWISQEMTQIYGELITAILDLLGLGGASWAAYGRWATKGEQLKLK